MGSDLQAEHTYLNTSPSHGGSKKSTGNAKPLNAREGLKTSDKLSSSFVEGSNAEDVLISLVHDAAHRFLFELQNFDSRNTDGDGSDCTDEDESSYIKEENKSDECADVGAAEKVHNAADQSYDLLSLDSKGGEIRQTLRVFINSLAAQVASLHGVTPISKTLEANEVTTTAIDRRPEAPDMRDERKADMDSPDSCNSDSWITENYSNEALFHVSVDDMLLALLRTACRGEAEELQAKDFLSRDAVVLSDSRLTTAHNSPYDNSEKGKSVSEITQTAQDGVHCLANFLGASALLGLILRACSGSTRSIRRDHRQ